MIGARTARGRTTSSPKTDGSPQAGGGAVARTRLRVSAEALFSRKGYAAASVREILSAAGVTAPTLYYHFGSKEGLYLDLLRGAWEEFERAWRGAVAGGGSPREKLHRLQQTSVEHFRAEGRVTRLLLGARYGPREGAPGFDSEPYRARLTAEIQGLLGEEAHRWAPEGWEVEAAGWTVVGALIAVVRSRTRDPGQPPGPEVAAGVADVVLRGLSDSPQNRSLKGSAYLGGPSVVP